MQIFFSSLLFLPHDSVIPCKLQETWRDAVDTEPDFPHSLIQQNYTRSKVQRAVKKKSTHGQGTLQHVSTALGMALHSDRWQEYFQTHYSHTLVHVTTAWGTDSRQSLRPLGSSEGLLDEGHALLIIAVSFMFLLFLTRLTRLCAVARHLQEQYRSFSIN